MKHNYDIAHNRYNSAKSRAAKLQAQYLKSKAACGRVTREQKAARAASSGLGNLKKAADSATHNERQWKIRYDHARG